MKKTFFGVGVIAEFRGGKGKEMPRRCPTCASEVSTDAPEGLCPACLYQQALAGAAAPEPEEPSRTPAPAFVPPPPAELAPRFPQLEILELVGQGGMGAVYKARHIKLDRLVAVKILPPEVARDPAFAERFTREARSLARLNHSNIVTVYDFGETAGLYYICMEFVDGQNVRQMLDSGAMLPVHALKIVPQVCEALQYAHDEGIVHRDIKPENILLDKKGRVKIADFGLARLVGLTPTYLTLTGSQEVMGTLYYMAPEQLKRAHLVDHRADLYSLGVVFYEMLTGELPMGRFAPPSRKAPVDERLDAVVMRALSREPENRYQDAGQMKREVEGLAAGREGGQAEATAQAPPPPGVAPSQWPIVSFKIPNVSWTGSKVLGDVTRDEEALVLQFEEVGVFGHPYGIREIKIPFTEIKSLTCHRHHGATLMAIRTMRPSTLGALPCSNSLKGRGRLVIPSDERDAAKQLVDSIVNRARPPRAPRAFFNLGSDLPLPKGFDIDRVRLDAAVPGVGLVLTGALAAVLNLILAGSCVMAFKETSEGVYLLIGAAALTGLPVALWMMIGAARMITLQSYASAVSVAFIAMLPWSPAWIFSLPLGIIALVVLRKPAVMAAFLQSRSARQAAKAAGASQGRVVSFFQSFAGYFLPTFAGKRRLSQTPFGPEAARKTVDYPVPPPAQPPEQPKLNAEPNK